MTNYKIDPQGVSGVLVNTQTAGTNLFDAVEPLESDYANVVTGCDDIALVSIELGAYLEHAAPALEGIGNHIAACLFGASSATNAYSAGDEDMAAEIATAQNNAIAAASSGDFSAFEDAGN